MDIGTLANTIESTNALARKGRRLRYTRQVWLDRRGCAVLCAGRDKGRGLGSKCARFRHNARSATGEHRFDRIGDAESPTQARAIVAGLCAFYDAQDWAIELLDARNGRRLKPEARPFLHAAVRERVIERPNPDYCTTAQRLERFIEAAAQESDQIGNDARRQDAERALEVAAPMLLALASRFSLRIPGQNLRANEHKCAVDFRAHVTRAQAGDRFAMKVLKGAGYDVNGKFVGDDTANAIESAKAAAVASVAEVADNDVSADDLLAVLNGMTADDFAESLFAHAG